MHRLWRLVSDRIPDLLWPHVVGEEEEVPDPPEPIRTTDLSTLGSAELELNRRSSEAHERMEGANSRLTPLLALASVVAGILTVGIPLLLTDEVLDLPAWMMILLISLVLYLVIQLLVCLSAAVTGLQRRNYSATSESDLVPESRPRTESEVAYRQRLFNTRHEHLWLNERETNQKFGQLAVAHRALQNAVAAVALLVVLSFTFVAIEGVDHDNIGDERSPANSANATDKSPTSTPMAQPSVTATPESEPTSTPVRSQSP